MHLYASDILSMPDKYVTTIGLVIVTSDFADGNILTSQHGTVPSIAFHLLWSILRLQRSSLTCSPVNGT